MSRLIPTRWSHLLSYSSVGALVRADNDLYVVKDIGHWTDRETDLKWFLSCDRCGASARFYNELKLNLQHPQAQPWPLGSSKSRPDVESKQKAQIFEVNDARLYFPRICTALVIPPESRIRRGSVLDLLYCSRADRAELERCRSKLGRKGALRRLADRYACSVGEVESAWSEIENGWPLYDQSVTPGGMLAKEFQALTEPIPDLDDGEDFVTRHKTNAWRVLTSFNGSTPHEPGVLSAVDRLVAVTRLREVRIFTGFTRHGSNRYSNELWYGPAR